ncbi:MAG: transcriptional regulator [Pseudomonadota bacterium]
MSSPFDLTQLSEMIHARTRLAVLTYLASMEDADFKAIREATATTEGNLSVHLQKLEEAGFIKISKTFRNRRPHTRARITNAGRDALIQYIDQVDEAFKKVRGALNKG